jgi:hypothetical protein
LASLISLQRPLGARRDLASRIPWPRQTASPATWLRFFTSPEESTYPNRIRLRFHFDADSARRPRRFGFTYSLAQANGVAGNMAALFHVARGVHLRKPDSASLFISPQIPLGAYRDLASLFTRPQANGAANTWLRFFAPPWESTCKNGIWLRFFTSPQSPLGARRDLASLFTRPPGKRRRQQVCFAFPGRPRSPLAPPGFWLRSFAWRPQTPRQMSGINLASLLHSPKPQTPPPNRSLSLFFRPAAPCAKLGSCGC